MSIDVGFFWASQGSRINGKGCEKRRERVSINPLLCQPGRLIKVTGGHVSDSRRRDARRFFSYCRILASPVRTIDITLCRSRDRPLFLGDVVSKINFRANVSRCVIVIVLREQITERASES